MKNDGLRGLNDLIGAQRRTIGNKKSGLCPLFLLPLSTHCFVEKTIDVGWVSAA